MEPVIASVMRLVKLMKTNVNRVIDGAEKAATMAKENLSKKTQLVLMVSCVGRKLVLKQLAQDEIEAVKNYDKLNRIYYSKAKELGMTVANYIMTHVVGNS